LMLYRAAALLDPRRAGRGDRSGYALVEEAEGVLRDELGQIRAPLLPEDMRHAALDAHEALCEAVPENFPRFKDVLDYLKQDLQHETAAD